MKVKLIFFLMLTLLIPLMAQERRPGKKPVLIRADEDDTSTEGPEKIYHHDPELAKKNVGIGDFYLKRDNYKAAEERYREAIKYNTKWPKAYEKLIKLFEKQKDYDAAIEACRMFIEANPDSEDLGKFEKRLRKLERKLDAG